MYQLEVCIRADIEYASGELRFVYCTAGGYVLAPQVHLGGLCLWLEQYLTFPSVFFGHVKGAAPRGCCRQLPVWWQLPLL